jgi:hypothetical protein
MWNTIQDQQPQVGAQKRKIRVEVLCAGTLPEELICEAWMLFTSTYNIQ